MAEIERDAEYHGGLPSLELSKNLEGLLRDKIAIVTGQVMA